jgi:L-threonylcarbamoyladenylate synthase
METTLWDAVADADKIQEAAALLRAGEVVVFPTETVYGAGGDATNDAAVARIFEAKGRPSDNPLIVHLADAGQVCDVAEGMGPVEQQLAARFWPGPLTLVLPAKAGVLSPRVTAGLATVAVRVPDHPVALALLRACGLPLAAPSANRSGRPSPTLATHVADDLGGRVAAILDGGATGVGLESTVVHVVDDPRTGTPVVHVLRPGGVTVAQLREAVGHGVAVQLADAAVAATEAPRAPGMKYAHYAPQGELTVVVIADTTVFAAYVVGEATRLVAAAAELGQSPVIGILAYDEHLDEYQALLDQIAWPFTIVSCGSVHDPASVAQHLYAALRQFDELGATHIFAEARPVHDGGLGDAVMNRLRKAADGKVITLKSYK